MPPNYPLITTKIYSVYSPYGTLSSYKKIQKTVKRFKSKLYSENGFRSGWPILTHFCWRQHLLVKKSENDVTWRNVTSSCRIFTKSSENVPLVDIILWWKNELICIILTEVVSILVFSASIWKSIGKSHLPLTKTP